MSIREKRTSLNEPLKNRRLISMEASFYDLDPQPAPPASFLQNLKDNWRSGLTVGLVNLPLCIALAVASGSTPSAGILSGIIGGVVHGFLGGSHYNIVGPTGALSGFLANNVFIYGIHALPYISFIVGLLILVVGKYGLQKYIDLFPLAVNEGFTLGVALIIILNQMNPALGLGKIEVGGFIQNNSTATDIIIMKVAIENEHSTLIHDVVNNIKHIDQTNLQTLIIYLIFSIALFILIKYLPLIPWHAVAAVCGIAIGATGQFKVETLYSKFGEIQMNLADFSYVQLSPTFLLLPTVWNDALPIAFIAILETLISAKIADSLTHTRFDKYNELKGLGFANLISGVLGGLPITAALARTTLNIKSGATNRISCIINGIILFLVSFAFISLFKYLPICVAAAQVTIVAIRMVNFEEIKILYEKDRPNFMILMTTATVCLLTDPVIGIVSGMLIYLMNFSENLINPWTEIITTSEIKAEDIIESDQRNSKYLSSRASKIFSSRASVYLTQEVKNNGQVMTNNYLVDNLNLFISDLPKGEGDYLLYRIIGIINFMNVSRHSDKIKQFAKDENMIVVISFRYLHFIDIEAMHAIEHLLHSIIKERKEMGNAHNKLFVTGLHKKNIKLFLGEEWINEMQQNGVLIMGKKS